MTRTSGRTTPASTGWRRPSPSSPWRTARGDRLDRSGRREDLHQRTITAADGVDFDKVQKEGVAFGMETNVGTLYVQRFGDNYRPWPLDD
jgi:hypothetical protein